MRLLRVGKVKISLCLNAPSAEVDAVPTAEADEADKYESHELCVRLCCTRPAEISDEPVTLIPVPLPDVAEELPP